MRWIAVLMFFVLNGMAEERQGVPGIKQLGIPPDLGAETRTGGAALQIDYAWPVAAPPPSEDCEGRYSPNISVNWSANDILGQFEGRDFEGDLFLSCQMKAFNSTFFHLNCPGIGSNPNDIDPGDPTFEHTPGDGLITLFGLGALGSPLPAGNYSFKFNGGFEFLNHDPATFVLTLGGKDYTKVLQAAPTAPYIVSGTFDNYEIQTRLLGSNTARWAVTASYEFNDSNGDPAPVRINGQVSSSFQWMLAPGATKAWDVLPAEEGGFFIGSGTIRSLGQSVQEQKLATEFITYRIQTNFGPAPQGTTKTLVGQAGIESSGVGSLHSLNVRKDASGVDTGFVLLNQTGVDANLTLFLLDTTPVQVAQAQKVLLHGHLEAGFALEYFGLEEEESFSGTAIIVSDVDIRTLSLRTLDGFQQGSLPSGVAGIP